MTALPLRKMGAVKLSERLRAKEIKPIDLLEDCLTGINEFNPVLNAIVTLDVDNARKAAVAAERQLDSGNGGPLCGLPVVIKDVTETAGMRTTYASPLYKDNVPERDAEVVARLRRAGAIILGKTNTPEFAAGATTFNELFGVTANPWDAERSPAGSSGGSAAAVASGMVPLAHGTDFGCSVRIPASFCGIVGLRTTPGLIPNDPMPLPWDPGQVHGPMARTAEDAALMLDAMVGFDPWWPISVPPTWKSTLDEVRRFDVKGVRVAYVSDIAGIGLDPEVDRVCRATVDKLANAGAQIITPEFTAEEGRQAYQTLRAEWMVGQQWRRLDLLDKFEKNHANNVRQGLALGVRDTTAAKYGRDQLLRKFRRLFESCDLLLTPAAPVLPFLIKDGFPTTIAGKELENYVDWIAPAFLITLVGMVGGAVPAGLSGDGLPVGLQIVGPRLSEPRVLGLARVIQELSPVGWPEIA